MSTLMIAPLCVLFVLLTMLPLLRNPMRCPRCGVEMPLIRKPAHGRQALWGGWRCTHCGCEMNRHGKPLE
jgi:hypothetical protein